VWLNAERLSDFDYWQFWRNTDDADVGSFLRLFTDLPLDEIAQLESLQGAAINDAKIRLADEATKLARGESAAAAAHETARRTFEEGGIGEELPTVEVPRAELERGIPLFELMRRGGLAESNGAARRLIKGGGARVNNRLATDEMQAATLADLGPEGVIKLSAGKKRHALVRPV
jgi:tyrosyl-tRNA synthetase